MIPGGGDVRKSERWPGSPIGKRAANKVLNARERFARPPVDHHARPPLRPLQIGLKLRAWVELDRDRLRHFSEVALGAQ